MTARSPGARSAANSARSSSSRLGTAVPIQGPPRSASGSTPATCSSTTRSSGRAATNSRGAHAGVVGGEPRVRHVQEHVAPALRVEPVDELDLAELGGRQRQIGRDRLQHEREPERFAQRARVGDVIGEEVLGVDAVETRSRRTSRRPWCGRAGGARRPTASDRARAVAGPARARAPSTGSLSWPRKSWSRSTKPSRIAAKCGSSGRGGSAIARCWTKPRSSSVAAARWGL